MRSFRRALETKAEVFPGRVKCRAIGAEFEAIASATRHKSGRATVDNWFKPEGGCRQNPKGVGGRARDKGARSQRNEANTKAKFHVETNDGNDVRAQEQVNGKCTLLARESA